MVDPRKTEWAEARLRHLEMKEPLSSQCLLATEAVFHAQSASPLDSHYFLLELSARVGFGVLAVGEAFQVCRHS